LQRANLWKRGTLTKLYKSKDFPQSFKKIRFHLVFPLLCGQKYSRLSPLFAVEILLISSLRKLTASATGGGRLLSSFQHPFSPFLYFYTLIIRENFDFWESTDKKKKSLTYLIASL